MKEINSFRKKIIEQPAYWVEAINNDLYNAVMDYMEEHDLNRTQLAKHLNLSRGRISQILNDGEINFSIEKLIEIALKIDKIPLLKLQNKEEYLLKEESVFSVINYNLKEEVFQTYKDKSENLTPKIIPMPITHRINFNLELTS